MMRTATLFNGIAFAILTLTLGGCGRAESGSADGEVANAPAGGAITIWTDSTELFMEHPALIVGAPDKFAVHLTDVTDFAPLRSGMITLRFVPRGGGAPVVVTQDVPRAPGIYGPAPAFTAPGIYDLTLIVNSPQARDSITVPNLRVYAKADDAPRETAGGESGVSFLKEQQWKTPGFRTMFAQSGSVMASFDAPGTIEPAAGRYADVTAPISGLVDPSSIATSPAPGQAVGRGQALAVLTPTLGEVGSAYAEARATLRETQDEYDRAKRLVDAEAAPQRRLHEAQNRLQAAREALAGLGGAGAGGRIVIRSPIAGVVATRTITPGSRVEAGTPLFTIVDARTVWLSVNVPAAQAPLVGRTSGAAFTIEGSPRRYTSTRTVSIGSVIDPQSRTVRALYEVNNSDASIRVGSNARVSVRTGQQADGVIIPVSAVLDEDGRTIVYVQPEGETFEKREVRLGGEQGGVVLVLDGVKAGERVVTGAAYQVRLASLSTAVPSQGHEH